MSDVRWIKITTDIFDDEKIQLIESMPEGDTLIVIWFKLLVLAGKQNYSGVLALGDKVFYTEDMLTTVFRRKSTTVKLALTTFEQFGMIAFVDGAVTIPNWEKHQNIDGLEKIRKQTRERVARHRQKQKALVSGQEQLQLECNVTETLQSVTGNASPPALPVMGRAWRVNSGSSDFIPLISSLPHSEKQRIHGFRLLLWKPRPVWRRAECLSLVHDSSGNE